MAGLNLFDLILPISHYSRDQLELFYLGEPQATVGLPQRLIACPLPGEFLESERIVELKPQSDQIEILSVGTLEPRKNHRSEEHTSELQSLMRISYAVFCLKKKKQI